VRQLTEALSQSKEELAAAEKTEAALLLQVTYADVC
jgi:hypothetical protein